MDAADYCIVVAEDDEMLRYCTVRLLSRHGYKIIEARDGIEALEIIEKCTDPIHLLVTNFDMPGLNGLDLARKLRARDQRLTVLMISGSTPDLDPTDDFEVLAKPYNEAVLASKVRELLRHASV
jgi:two-component system cell cycle sensor histidine kinase/response regulator CckA